MKRDIKPINQWSQWWVAMFAVFAVSLIVAAPFVAFWHWWSLAGIFFGVPETIGAFKQDDEYPPLTHIIVRYVHPEIAMTLLFGIAGGIGAFWIGFPHPEHIGLLVGLIGWLNAHFLPRFLKR